MRYSLSTARWKCAIGVHLQSFSGARGMSNALKIGGNVLHSITTHKRALSGSWEKLILSQHRGMSAPRKSATIKVHSSSELKCLPHMFFLKNGLDCEYNFANHSEFKPLLNVPIEVRILSILHNWRALSQTNKKRFFLMSVR